MFRISSYGTFPHDLFSKATATRCIALYQFLIPNQLHVAALATARILSGILSFNSWPSDSEPAEFCAYF